MSHSYVNNLVHCVFSTKERKPLIGTDLQKRLWAFLSSVAIERGMTVVAVGGMEDHVHILVAVPATMALAKAVQSLKGVSSKWIHDEFPEQRQFAWQAGYGAFSVSRSRLDATAAYIRNQREHHRSKSFEQEFVLLLEKHGIEFDPKYVFG